MNRVKGTYDIYGDYSNKFRQVEDHLYKISRLYNYEYIKTPIIEHTSLYHREKNNTDDIIIKHTYDFEDLSGKKITLRPEMNSGVLRAIIENNMYTRPRKVFYYGDVFRYDKPQKDRYREFTQFGFENIGNDNPIIDADMIFMAYEIYREFGIKNISIKMNSLGSIDDINNYRFKLIKYFEKYQCSLCEDCKKRLKNNPLRILSCKNQNEIELFKDAPKLLDSISKESLIKFEKVLKYLDQRNIDYEVDHNFIRGIDYQNDTIFEIINTSPEFVANNNLCGGGRYDNLYNHLINKNIPAFGFDFGLERLIASIENENMDYFTKPQIDLFIINLCEDDGYINKIIYEFRKRNVSIEFDARFLSFKSQLRFSDNFNTKYTAFIGQDEINNDIISFRDNINNIDFKATIDEFCEIVEKEKGRRLIK